MQSQFESLKQDVEHLCVLALRLVIHGLLLAAVLLFVLLAVWIHQWFRRAYHRLDEPQIKTQKVEPHNSLATKL